MSSSSGSSGGLSLSGSDMQALLPLESELDATVDKADVKKSVRVCLVYYFHWLKGIGAVAYENLMEVSSTVEICRLQLWSWLQ